MQRKRVLANAPNHFVRREVLEERVQDLQAGHEVFGVELARLLWEAVRAEQELEEVDAIELLDGAEAEVGSLDAGTQFYVCELFE